MKDSKKSSKKKNSDSNKKRGRKIVYGFFLLLLANGIVFLFLTYFLYRIYDNKISTSSYKEIPFISVPVVTDKTNIRVSALSYIVYDPLSRSIVFSKNHNLRMSPASSIKILTALVALDTYRLDDYLTVPVVASYDESKMGLKLGEEIKVGDLLYGLLLVSGNDAAKTFAYNYPGGNDAFISAMNSKAKELEFSDSNFLDASGYQDNNYSTAFELARLASVAMQNSTIREIVGTKEKTVYDKYNFFVHPLKNLNELLSVDKVTGVKTGFTNEAGGVLVTSFFHEGRELIIVVMKSNDRFADTRKIISIIKSTVYYSGFSDDKSESSFNAGT